MPEIEAENGFPNGEKFIFHLSNVHKLVFNENFSDHLTITACKVQ